MPELPDLEIVKDVLHEHILGVTITEVQVKQPLVLRCTLDDLSTALVGSSFTDVWRRGKFLLLDIDFGYTMAINAMLAGRFHLARLGEKLKPRTCVQVLFKRNCQK